MTLSKHPGAEIAGSYELIERLMLHLPRRDLVLSQLINKAFKDVFERSERVKTIFRMKLPAERETVYLNTRPQGPFRVIRLNRPLHRVVQIELLSFDQQLHMSDAGAQSSWRQEPIWLPKTSNEPTGFHQGLERDLDRDARLDSITQDLSGIISLGRLADVVSKYIEELPPVDGMIIIPRHLVGISGLSRGQKALLKAHLAGTAALL